MPRADACRPEASQSVRRAAANLPGPAKALSTRPVDNGVHERVGEVFHACRAKGVGEVGERIASLRRRKVKGLHVKPRQEQA